MLRKGLLDDVDRCFEKFVDAVLWSDVLQQGDLIEIVHERRKSDGVLSVDNRWMLGEEQAIDSDCLRSRLGFHRGIVHDHHCGFGTGRGFH